MITVTKQEIVDFINGQPQSRPVDMRENFFDEPCGCVMVHYGKEMLKFDKFGCGYKTWHPLDSFEKIAEISDSTITGILGDYHRALRQNISMNTYGDLQKILASN